MTDPIDRSGTVSDYIGRIMAYVNDGRWGTAQVEEEIKAVLYEIMGCPHDGACACAIFTRHELLEENRKLHSKIRELEEENDWLQQQLQELRGHV